MMHTAYLTLQNLGKASLSYQILQELEMEHHQQREYTIYVEFNIYFVRSILTAGIHARYGCTCSGHPRLAC